MLDKSLTKEAFSKPLIIALLTAVSILTAAAIVAQAYLLSAAVNMVFLQMMVIEGLWNMLFILLMVFILRGLLAFMHTRAGAVLAAEAKRSLRNRLITRFEELGPAYLVEEKTGRLVGVLTEGIDQLDPYFSRYLPQVLQALIISPIILIVVFSHSILSGAIMLVTAPLIPVFMYLIGSMAEAKSQKQLQSLLRFSGHFLDVLQGLTTLKLFGRSREQSKSIAIMSDGFRDTTMDVLKIAFLSALMLEILATISTAMIAVEVGLRLVYGLLTFQVAFFVLLLTPELYLPLKNLGASFHSGRTSIGAWKEICATVERDVEKPQWGSKAFPQPLPPGISLSTVDFSYNGHKKVLSGIDFHINPGERLAFVGQSGSGKSTLLKLLMGLLVPDKGRVLINGIPQFDISQEEWFSHIAYVSQDPYIFSGTIAENIALGRPNAPRKEIIRAAKRARVDDFVKELPMGYDTMIGDGHRGLSGGEKQRIAIARVILKKASIVLLDEPTAGLDLESESLVQEAISELAGECTLVTVAHGRQTIIDADRIVVLRNGAVEAVGAHKELFNSSEHYRQLVSG
ncbi:MAG: thiol reductant ABC exporter subunit CydD [Clostridia bacterium]|nr:thiol reductant ABC exporter subunit CydD [Clostridia bacterium]